MPSKMKSFIPVRRFGLLLFFVFVFTGFAFATDIRLELDAADAAANRFRIRQTMPAKPGPMELFYPKWIPGEHAPTGPLNDMVALKISADGVPLEWKRDDVEMFAFKFDVPPGSMQLEVSFEYVSQPYTIASASLARLKWNRFVLYPRGEKSDDVRVAASLRVPNGWDFATALPVEKRALPNVTFKQVTLAKFVDSPAIIGRYMAKLPLGNSDVYTEMSLAADSPDALKASAATVAGWKNMIRQGEMMFGARHYDSYYFLTTLSDYGGDEGLEHHESSENGVGVLSLADRNGLLDLNELLGHEYVHSWNGKHRRPATLLTPDFEQPMHGELLWVYEGLTQYLGRVLPARSGLWTEQMFRESAAETTAMMDTQFGRRWRPLVDTARAVQFTYPSAREWMNARRRVDYYYEGALIWMEADVLIRKGTANAKSLDDFLHKFHGGEKSGPTVKAYDLAEIVRTLNEVHPFDWNKFFIDRVYKVQINAPQGGITEGGWRLVYDSTPNAQIEIDSGRGGYLHLMYSVGMLVNADGYVLDVIPESVAAKAGLAPGMSLKTINGSEFTIDLMKKTIADTKLREATVSLGASSGGKDDLTLSFTYQGGLRYPHLERDPAKADYLSGITKPIR